MDELNLYVPVFFIFYRKLSNNGLVGGSGGCRDGVSGVHLDRGIHRVHGGVHRVLQWLLHWLLLNLGSEHWLQEGLDSFEGFFGGSIDFFRGLRGLQIRCVGGGQALFETFAKQISTPHCHPGPRQTKPPNMEPTIASTVIPSSRQTSASLHLHIQSKRSSAQFFIILVLFESKVIYPRYNGIGSDIIRYDLKFPTSNSNSFTKIRTDQILMFFNL